MAKKVLVVDDEEAIRKSVGFALYLNRGFEIVEAENGLDGLDLAQKQKPDLIISDVIMDNMNGFMMLESLRNDPETTQIPVIMMTSFATSAGAWKTGGAVEYLEKGFSVEDLLAAVDKILTVQPADEEN
jgi:two-component system, sensor histidine kinase and response regulator